MSRRAVPTGPVRKSVGRKLRAAREQRRWTLAVAAEKTGITRVTLGSWERGDRAPSLDGLWVVVQAYGMRVAELFPPQDGAPVGPDDPLRPQAQDLYAALEEFRGMVDRIVGSDVVAGP